LRKATIRELRIPFLLKLVLPTRGPVELDSGRPRLGEDKLAEAQVRPSARRSVKPPAHGSVLAARHMHEERRSSLVKDFVDWDNRPGVPNAPTSPSAKDGGGTPKFASDAGFHTVLKRRVLAYFEEQRLSPKASTRMYVKTAVLLVWFGASYGLLVFAATTTWEAMLLSISLALAMAGIGFGVQHDANHGAYSGHGGLNRLLGLTLDMLGASSYVWRFKHNVSHHTYTNVAGVDDDIDIGPFARLAPAQPRHRFHRVQQFYLWALYGFLIPKWHFVYDFKNVARARIARNRFARPRGWDLVELIGGKALFFGWAFVLPALFHPWWLVLLYYAGIAFLLGFILSVVFQLAHCVEEADFPVPSPGADRLRDAWAVHQVQTTVDFAQRNPLLTWYFGGLNFQIEHHLFPRICHIHYPRIAGIVQATCAELGVRYSAHQSLFAALSSHWRWLRRMGP
jgi:linoleoyl-CoA desaturase